MKNDYIYMQLNTKTGEGLIAYELNDKYYISIDNNKKEVSEKFFKAIKDEFPENEDSFSEKLKTLSKSIGTVNIGEDSDKICREVRGKE